MMGKRMLGTGRWNKPQASGVPPGIGITEPSNCGMVTSTVRLDDLQKSI